MNRDEISKKYGISSQKLTCRLNYHKIDLWDSKIKKRIKKRIKTTKYYNKTEYKNNIMFNYNK
ncbi:MAG: hypothetical protein WHS65_10115 [Melioribacteraceae bacterium]